MEDTSSATNITVAEKTSEEREQPVVEEVNEPSTSSIATATTEDQDQEDSPSKTKRKNRCTTCRKKVGLTGVFDTQN